MADDIDIDVSDLGAEPFTPAQQERVSEIAAKARTIRRAAEKKIDERIDKLETLLTTALSVLIPGLGAPNDSTKKDKAP